MNASPTDPEKRRLEASPPEDRAPDLPLGGGTPHSPYPDYSVTRDDKWALDWDEKTRRLVLDRMHHIPQYRFFSEEEVQALEALCARLLPQDDRPLALRIPIAPWIDER